MNRSKKKKQNTPATEDSPPTAPGADAPSPPAKTPVWATELFASLAVSAVYLTVLITLTFAYVL